MKKNQKIELKLLSVQDMVHKIEMFRRDLFNVRLNSVTSHVKDVSQFKRLRRSIARGLTYLKEHQNVNSTNR